MTLRHNIMKFPSYTIEVYYNFIGHIEVLLMNSTIKQQDRIRARISEITVRHHNLDLYIIE